MHCLPMHYSPHFALSATVREEEADDAISADHAVTFPSRLLARTPSRAFYPMAAENMLDQLWQHELLLLWTYRLPEMLSEHLVAERSLADSHDQVFLVGEVLQLLYHARLVEISALPCREASV
jgi:hypothetical protein